MTKEISTSQKRCSIHTIVSPLLLYLKKKKKNDATSTSVPGFRQVQKCGGSRDNRLRLCLASNDRSEFRASGGGEVTAVRCAGGCRGLKGQLSLLSAREQQEQKM